MNAHDARDPSAARPVRGRAPVVVGVGPSLASPPSAPPRARRPRRPRACVCDTDSQQHLLADGPGRLRLHPGRQLDLHVELRQQQRATSSCPARRSASRRARPVTVVLHNTLPEATSIVFPGQKGVQGQRQPGPAAVRRRRLADLDGAAGGRDRRLGHLHVHRRQPRHLPLRERHRRRQAGADGPVRRARRPARRRTRPGQRPRRLGVQPAATSTSSSSRRSTRTCTWRSSAASRSTGRPTTRATS